MRRSYASGYSRSSRRDPSLVWFVLGAIAIAAGYLYLSGLGDKQEEVAGGNPEEAGQVSGAATSSSVSEGGTNESSGEIVRVAIPIIEEEIGAVPSSGSAWKSGSPQVMSWIPEGEYMVRIGDEIESKSFQKGFWLAVRPVREMDYEDLTGVNPVPVGKRDPKAPVTRISWDDARGYARKLTEREWLEKRLPRNYEYRLPTEGMWEFAAGGGDDGKALRVREEGSRSLSWWRLNGVREFSDSRHEGPLRAGPLDVGLITEWTLDDAENAQAGMGVKIARGAPHTAFLGRENGVVKARYSIFHKDEKLPFLGFRLVLVKTGPDPDEGGPNIAPTPLRQDVVIRPLRPGEQVDYVRRTQSFSLDELFTDSNYATSSRLTKYQLLRKVQTELKKYGYYTARVDGYPGRGTQRAIDKFQAVSGLPKTGKLDTNTLRSLGIQDEPTSTTGERTAIIQPAPTVSLVSESTESRPTVSDSSSMARPVSNSNQTPIRRASVVTEPTEVEVAVRHSTPRTISPPVTSSRPAGRYYHPPQPAYRAPQPREAPDGELRYDGFRGKLRQASDVLFGTYDPREDRRYPR